MHIRSIMLLSFILILIIWDLNHNVAIFITFSAVNYVRFVDSPQKNNNILSFQLYQFKCIYYILENTY